MSKESIFSGLNNLEVVTTTSKKYEADFGFTESEVLAALDEQGYTDEVFCMLRNVKGYGKISYSK